LQKTGHLAEAEQLHRQSASIQELLVSQDPESPQHPFDLGFARASLGRVLIEAGRTDEGRRELELSAEISEILLKSDPGNPQYRLRLAGVYESLGDDQAAHRDWKPALASYRHASELVQGGTTPPFRDLERRLSERIAANERFVPR
jgi:tetratricopeptide (TPR) repeat protein